MRAASGRPRCGRNAFVERLQFRNYAVIAIELRGAVGRVGWGILILAHTLFRAMKTTLPGAALEAIESRSIGLLPAARPVAKRVPMLYKGQARHLRLVAIVSVIQ